MAIFISMTLCTVIYLFVNVAYFSILTPFEMMASPAVANTVANLFLQVGFVALRPFQVFVASILIQHAGLISYFQCDNHG